MELSDIDFTGCSFRSDVKRFIEIHAGIDFSYNYYTFIRCYAGGFFVLKEAQDGNTDFEAFLDSLSPAVISSHQNLHPTYNYEDYVTGKWKIAYGQLVLEWEVESPAAMPVKKYMRELYLEAFMPERPLRDNMGCGYTQLPVKGI